MRKPVVLVSPQMQGFPGGGLDISLYLTTDSNFNWVSRNGGIPIMSSFQEGEDLDALVKMSDGVFLTGGADVDPGLYGEEKKDYCDEPEPDRDKSDFAIISAALKFKKPILFVCRGSQIGNVYFGGTLYQDLKTDFGDKIIHPDYATYKGENSHALKIVKGTPLYDLMGREEIGVNSLHHQGIKDLGKGLKVMGTAPDGLVESWYYDEDGQWARAYQWHPEFQDENPRNILIMKDFLDKCREGIKE